MDYFTLGSSGLQVSRACLGAMNFGTALESPCDETEGRRMIDEFLDAGHNFIDTANVYTGGESEEIVGRALRGRRDSVVLATKGRLAQGPGPNDAGASRVHLTRALEASLRRLGTDHIDVYQMHSWDPGTPIEETMATLDSFVRSGKVRYIGCSNYTGSQIVEAQWAAARGNGVRFVSLQPPYSLVARQIEADVLPACARHGLGVLVYSPLGGGILTGRYRRGAAVPAGTRIARRLAMRPGSESTVLSERVFDIVHTVEKIAAELDATPTAVSLAWVASRRGVTSVIIGPRTLEQFRENLPGFALELPDEALQALSAVSKPT